METNPFLIHGIKQQFLPQDNFPSSSYSIINFNSSLRLALFPVDPFTRKSRREREMFKWKTSLFTNNCMIYCTNLWTWQSPSSSIAAFLYNFFRLLLNENCIHTGEENWEKHNIIFEREKIFLINTTQHKRWIGVVRCVAVQYCVRDVYINSFIVFPSSVWCQSIWFRVPKQTCTFVRFVFLKKA